MIKISVLGLRKKTGLSQKELAKILGISQASVSRMEMDGYFSKKHIDKVCDIFEIPKEEDVASDFKEILTAIKDNGYIVKFNKGQIDEMIEKYEEFL